MIVTAEVLGGLFVYFCGVQYTYAYRKRRFQLKSSYYSDNHAAASHVFTICAAIVWPVWWFARLTDFAAWLDGLKLLEDY